MHDFNFSRNSGNSVDSIPIPSVFVWSGKFRSGGTTTRNSRGVNLTQKLNKDPS